MVNHIAIRDGRSPWRKPQDQDRNAPRLGADFRKRPEATNAAVKETGGLRIQFATQLYRSLPASAISSARDMQTMRFQQCGQRVGIRGIEARMYVAVNTETERLRSTRAAQRLGAGDHRSSSTIRLAIRRGSATISSTSPRRYCAIRAVF
ncbi:hypothetical protein KCP78_07430 [Salmonella enterica subsp. enterica]|nr:hypothetical protein KCP78_07430 [Salmonella enterica subsp. enterica]